MTPFSFEWQWNADYFIFMGLLYLALLIIGCGLLVAYVRAWMDAEAEDGHGEGASEPAPSRRRYSEF